MTTFPAQAYRDYLKEEIYMENRIELRCPDEHTVAAHACDTDTTDCGCVWIRQDYGGMTWDLCPLHAAAPRLAEALRQAVDVLDRSYRHGKLIDLNNGLLHKAIDDARQALADIDGGKE